MAHPPVLPPITYTDYNTARIGNPLVATVESSVQAAGITRVTAQGTLPNASGPGPHVAELLTDGALTVGQNSGYQYVYDQSPGTPLALQADAAATYLLGNENLNVTVPGGSGGTIVAGNGTDTFDLSGAYNATAGSGSDFWKLAGTGQVHLGTGTNAVLVSGGADTIFAAPKSGGGNLLVANEGSFTYFTAANTVLSVDTVVGGAGATAGTNGFDMEVWGNQNAAVDLINASQHASAVLLAGAGNETLVGANSTGDVDLWANQNDASSHDVLFASGSGTSGLLSGAGTDTLVGGGGRDVFYVVAQTAKGAHAQDFVYNANGKDIMQLTGYDTMYGGAAGSGAAAKAVGAQLAAGGSSVVLKDGTTITFANTHGLNGMSLTST